MSADPPASATPDQPGHDKVALRRALSLPLLVLYGLGVTIGAGIYVLIGAAAGRAGIYAPLSFLVAAVVMGFSAASFAELTGRYPVSAGEAAYVRGAFGSNALSLLAGSLVIFTGVVSSAAIAGGAAGYMLEFIDYSEQAVIACVVLIMGAISIWGIVQSVTFAGLLWTIIAVWQINLAQSPSSTQPQNFVGETWKLQLLILVVALSSISFVVALRQVKEALRRQQHAEAVATESGWARDRRVAGRPAG